MMTTNKRISELNEVTLAENEDLFVMVETASGETKKIKFENLFKINMKGISSAGVLQLGGEDASGSGTIPTRILLRPNKNNQHYGARIEGFYQNLGWLRFSRSASTKMTIADSGVLIGNAVTTKTSSENLHVVGNTRITGGATIMQNEKTRTIIKTPAFEKTYIGTQTRNDEDLRENSFVKLTIDVEVPGSPEIITITGMMGGEDGKIKTIHGISEEEGSQIIFNHEDGNSSAENRICIPDGTNKTINTYKISDGRMGTISFIYHENLDSSGNGRWVMTSHGN